MFQTSRKNITLFLGKSNESNQSNDSNDILDNRETRSGFQGFIFLWKSLLKADAGRDNPATLYPGSSRQDWGLPCPDWYASGLMVIGGWFDSAHGRQVYPHLISTPLAFWLGAIFLPNGDAHALP